MVVVAPTYNNARTLRAVLDGVAAHGLPVIACDDGSTDATASLLAEWLNEPHVEGTRFVVTHGINQGKAAAMRSGFAHAATLGFTHALTIDTDGQHDPSDVVGLLYASATNPQAMIVGVRPIDDVAYPFRSRLGRALSNGLVWFIGGVHVSDSQCGLRVYPIALVRELGAHTSRYAFETEVLARAGWANVDVFEVPIRCIYVVDGQTRVTHFRPWADSISAAWMHSGLILRSILPWPSRKAIAVDDETRTGTLFERCLRWCNPLRTWRQVRVNAAERERVAASVGVGLFVGCQPWFGVKTIVCLAVARVLSLQPLVTIGASSLTTPPVGFAVWTLSIAVGHLALHGSWPDAARYDVRTLGAAAVFKSVASEWIVGGIIVGCAVGITAWSLTRLAMRRWREDRHETIEPSTARNAL